MQFNGLHWKDGTFCYFPSYTLGTMYVAIYPQSEDTFKV
ncbi:hypothetical protein LMH72_06550 [Vibrio splendidus]|nr:hypothetical protein [Vibrio splendidus]